VKKSKDEKELVKKAIIEGMRYGEQRGVVEFEPTDSATEKIEYIYRLLVHDKIIQPVPQDQISQLAMKHKLAIWASKLK
jgi:hypothetical protein